MSRNLILNDLQIRQRITRISAEILETNYNESEIVIAGIIGNGFNLAKLLVKELNEAPFKIELVEVKLNKKNLSLSDITIEPLVKLDNKSVVLVDDVLNSGKTFCFAMAAFLDYNVRKIQSAVLVNRSYKNFPVCADFVGLSLSTTLEEHVSVEFSDKEIVAYLH